MTLPPPSPTKAATAITPNGADGTPGRLGQGVHGDRGPVAVAGKVNGEDAIGVLDTVSQASESGPGESRLLGTVVIPRGPGGVVVLTLDAI